MNQPNEKENVITKMTLDQFVNQNGLMLNSRAKGFMRRMKVSTVEELLLISIIWESDAVYRSLSILRHRLKQLFQRPDEHRFLIETI